ncbi:hypothetical protein BC835DRAFT_1307562 [Cytidiella melzeri]|nr:hypothetical protein BC835DRAFT_1307562 [Cytidiella melzeri]
MPPTLQPLKKDPHGLGRNVCNNTKECTNCRRVCAARGFQSHFIACEEQRRYAETLASRKRAAASDLHRTPKRGTRELRYSSCFSYSLPQVVTQDDPSSARASPEVSSVLELSCSPQMSQYTNLFGLDILPNVSMEKDIHKGSSAVETQSSGTGHVPLKDKPREHGQVQVEPDLNFDELEEEDFDENTLQAAPQDLAPEVDNPTDNQNFTPGEAPSASSATSSQIDNIKIEFHKSSHCPTCIYSFANFKRNERTVCSTLLKAELWKPFKTRLDFEVVELINQMKLNASHTDRLLKVIKRIMQNPSDFTLKSAANLNQHWQSAKMYYLPFTTEEITIPYNSQPKTFEFHSRSLWEWILSQVQDPLLVPHFKWDTQCLSKFNGTKWVCFYDEPWTASKFAQVQSQSHASSICSGGKPLAIILWADTSVLSTFGTQKGHYIVACHGNLPMSIRNGNYVGGGRVVGFVPIVRADSAEQGEVKFVNWKRAVFHEAFCNFLKDVARLSKNALWDVENLDIHEAISFECLHVYIIGLFQKYILLEIKILLDNLGRWAKAVFNQGFQTMERWPNLTNFTHGLFQMDFSDGKKWEHTSKSRRYNNTVSACITDYNRHCEGNADSDVKNWDGIIKVHSRIHAACNIWMKDVIANMDTKLGKLYGRDQAVVSIRAHLDALDEQAQLLLADVGPSKEPKTTEWQFAQVYLGSRQKPTNLKDFTAQAAHDNAFIRFRQKLADCLTAIIARKNPPGIQFPQNH